MLLPPSSRCILKPVHEELHPLCVDTCTKLPGKPDMSPEEGTAPPVPIRWVNLLDWGTGGPGEPSGCVEAQMESNQKDLSLQAEK